MRRAPAVGPEPAADENSGGEWFGGGGEGRGRRDVLRVVSELVQLLQQGQGQGGAGGAGEDAAAAPALLDASAAGNGSGAAGDPPPPLPFVIIGHAASFTPY